MSKTLQQEIANGITKKFKDAVIKKIDKDNYLDIHLPSVHPKKGTHLGINTAKGEIKLVFYCREDDFNTLALKNSKKIEEYAQGLRIKGNPAFSSASKAVEAAIDFVLELMRVNGNVSKSETTETKTPKTALNKSVPKKASIKKDDKSIEKGEEEQKAVEASKKDSDFKQMIKAYKKGDLEKVADFVKKGNPPLQFNQDESVIENELIAVCAAVEVDLDVLKRMIKRGDNLNARNNDEDKYTAVHFCAWDGKVKALSLLLKSGASPDIIGADGRTALHLATAMGHADAVEILLKAEVDINRRIPDGNKYYSKNGASALREALINQRWEVVDLLLEAGAEISGLNEPCVESYKGKKDLFDVIRLLEKDGEYSEGNFDGDKLDELEKKVKGNKVIQSRKPDSVTLFQIGDKVNATMFKKSAKLDFWLGDYKEKIIKDILYSDEHEKYLVLTADKKGNSIDYWDMEAVNTQLIDKYKFEFTEEDTESEQEEDDDQIETDIGDEQEEEVEIENEEEEQEENNTENDSDDDESDDLSFSDGKSYQKYFIRFSEIAEKTGVSTNKIKVEPDIKERDELWEITRAFADRIYQLDNEKSPDQNEINLLSYYAIVALHWCDIYDHNDKRYSYLNGRFRRDTVALALCFYARINRSFKYYDFIKESMIMPHMQFSVLMWTINTIINNNQDTLFGLFNSKQAEQANNLFKELSLKNTGADPVNPNEIPDNHPLKSIWWELYRQFNNVRIPYQFIKSYISQLPPQRSFVQNLFSSNKANVKPGMNVTLLEEDRIKNVAFLEKQIAHKQFPAEWIFINDLAFVSIYFATTTDGQLSEIEKNTICKLVGEWITEEDESELKKQVNDAFIKAKAEFDKDKSHERFEFALENIRRNLLINYEYDEEKTHKQLILVFNDLVAISNSDDDQTTEEVDLLKAILAEWKIEMSEVTGDNSDEDETDEEDEKLKALLLKYGVESESELTSITMEQAKELSNCKVCLNLSGLTSLSEKSAEVLAKHEGDLILDGLTSLSDKAFNLIATHTGGYLSLEGFTTLSDTAARALSQNKELLFLKGLTTLSDNAAKLLAQQNGSLLLDGLTNLSERAAELLASHKGGYLSLDGLTSLSDKALEALAKHQGSLYLNGLTSLSDKAALAFSKHKEELCLNGLTKLSEKAAIALSKHEGELSLGGLITLSDKAAAALAEKGISISQEEGDDDESDDEEEEIVESDIEADDIDYGQYDLEDLDVNDDEVVNKICSKIKKEKVLTNLLYVNKILDEKGYEVDNHQAYFFVSKITFIDNEGQNSTPFLLVNMDGFYSNYNDEEEIMCVLSWDNILDMKMTSFSNIDTLSIRTKTGWIALKVEDSSCLNILYTFYQNIWKLINEKFVDEPMIFWDEVWEMGIKELSYSTPENYFKLIND